MQHKFSDFSKNLMEMCSLLSWWREEALKRRIFHIKYENYIGIKNNTKSVFFMIFSVYNK